MSKMSFRIAVGQLSHETNTFSAELTDEAVFRKRSWIYGEEIFNKNQGVRSYIGGMLDEGAAIGGIEFTATFAATTNPSGYITAETWSKIQKNMLEEFRKAAPFDAICLDLHGAGVSETSYDIEGDLLEILRKEFGPSMPIVSTLDLHGNITEKMVENANLLLGVNEYPHVDSYERGREVVGKLYRMLKGELHPVMSLTRLPMVIPTTTTFYGPALVVNEKCQEWEEKNGILDCTFFHGFPYADTPEICVSVLAAADGDEELAKQASEDVAAMIWEMREVFQISLPTAAEGLQQALAMDVAPIVINETSDNPGAGGPGDGTHLLKELLNANVPNTCFAHICDSEAVAIAYQAGESTAINLALGGKKDRLHGSPLPVSAEVIALRECVFTASTVMGRGRKVNLGRGVRLRIGNVDVIVTEIKSQLLDDEMLKLYGLNFYDMKVLAIKSSQHFRAFFQEAAAKIITIDSPGISTFDFSAFHYASAAKYKYPLSLIGASAVPLSKR